LEQDLREDSKKATVYIVSDGTGETASTMIKAALVHYTSIEANIVRCKNVRTESQMDSVVADAFEAKAILVHTVASQTMRRQLTEKAVAKGVPVFDLLGPLLDSISISE
jgi:[pyruvate, water dikinase]-phosphate phosphotransferase / [pyruvate, water dikinase] kinase